VKVVVAWSDLSYDQHVAIAIILVLVVIVLVAIDVTVHVARRPPDRGRDDAKIIVDLTKRK
jgi:hypothetical protein